MDDNVRTFLSKAARMGEAKPVLPLAPRGTWRSFSYGPFENLHLGLRGQHQIKNAAVAIETLVSLKEHGFAIDNRHVRQGLKDVGFPGRLEVREGTPPILLDGAHNEGALRALVEYLREEYAGRKISVVLGMMKEKDVSAALKILSPLGADFYFTEVPSPRSLTLQQWREICGRMKISGEFIGAPREALEAAKRRSDPNGLVVVTGSLYLVGAVRVFV
jgi:dihydrofolate synthase/folylpolyglutamate synthase